MSKQVIILAAIGLGSCVVAVAADATRLDSGTQIPLGAVVSVIAVVIPSAIYIGKKLTAIEDAMTRLSAMEKRFEELMKLMETRPCMIENVTVQCPTKPKTSL